MFFLKRIISGQIAALCIMVGMLATGSVQAGVVIDSTRIVYDAKEPVVTVKLENKDSTPVLVQAWLDTGNMADTPDMLDVPFILTPPIFRMEGGKSRTIRMTSIRESIKASLPTGKESVFWLNVLEVPPKADVGEIDVNTLQFAYRTRIKVFYRPENLVGRVEDSPSGLQWKLVKNGIETALEVRNPSAYHVSFSRVAVALDGTEIESENRPMVAPGKTERFVLKGLPATHAAKAEVRFKTIDDYGADVSHAAAL